MSKADELPVSKTQSARLQKPKTSAFENSLCSSVIMTLGHAHAWPYHSHSAGSNHSMCIYGVLGWLCWPIYRTELTMTTNRIRIIQYLYPLKCQYGYPFASYPKIMNTKMYIFEYVFPLIFSFPAPYSIYPNYWYRSMWIYVQVISITSGKRY